MERLQAARSELTELERLAAQQRERKVAQGSSSPNVARGVRRSIANLKGEIRRLARAAALTQPPAARNLAGPLKIANVSVEPHESDAVINKASNAQDTYDLLVTLPIGAVVHIADERTVDGKFYQYSLVNNGNGVGPFTFREVGMDNPREIMLNPLRAMPAGIFEMRVPISTISAAHSSKNPMESSAPAPSPVDKPSGSDSPRESSVEDLLRDGAVTLDSSTSLEDFARIISAVKSARSNVVYVDEEGKKRVARIVDFENFGTYIRIPLLYGGSRSVNVAEFSDSMRGKILVPRSVVRQDSQSKAPKKSAAVRYDVNDDDSMTPRAFYDKLVIGKTRVKFHLDGVERVCTVSHCEYYPDSDEFELEVRVPDIGTTYLSSTDYVLEIVE